MGSRKKKRQYGDAEWKSDFLKFSDQLEAIGLTIKDVAGDGNCLFRSMSDQFTGDPNNYANYRRQICDYIYHNREDFEPFIEDDEPFEEYIARMRRNATWGGHLEIQACSILYQVNITIHQINQPRWELGFPGNAIKTIHFSYHQGQHYSSVRMIGDVSRNGPPAPIELNIKPRGSTSTQKKPPEIFIPTEEELIIMDHTGCTNLEFIRHVLMENFGDIDASVEFVLIIGPDNTEFQKEYLDKPYDPTNFEKPSQTSKPTETKEKKNQNAANKNNNNNRANYKPQPQQEIKKETKVNKLPAHESNKERKQRLKLEKENEPKPIPPSQTPQTESTPLTPADEVSILSVDLGSVQI